MLRSLLVCLPLLICLVATNGNGNGNGNGHGNGNGKGEGNGNDKGNGNGNSDGNGMNEIHEINVHYISYYSAKAIAYSEGAFRSRHGWIRLEPQKLESTLELLPIELLYIRTQFGYNNVNRNGFFVIDPPDAEHITVYVMGYGRTEKDAGRMNAEFKERMDETFHKERKENGDENGSEEPREDADE